MKPPFPFLIFFWVGLLSGFTSKSQDFTAPEALNSLEAEMSVLQHSIAEKATDTERQAENQKLIAAAEKAFEVEGVFEYPFSKLEKIATLRSPDGAFRIFNWNLPHTDGTYSYFLYLLTPKKNGVEVTKFYDRVSLSQITEQQEVQPENWYGAIYYHIQPVNKGKKGRYVLLGWDGNDRSTTFKVIETLSLKQPEMGVQILETEKETEVARRIFEYSNSSVMTLEFVPEMDAVVFNDLVPLRGGLEGQYQYYGPGVAMHAYVEEKGAWRLRQNVPMRRPKELETKDFSTPEGTDFNRRRSQINPLTGKPKR